MCLILSDNIIVVVADVFEKFLEQEKARLLEQAQLDEENEANNLVSCVKVCKKNDDTSAWFHISFPNLLDCPEIESNPSSRTDFFSVENDLHDPHQGLMLAVVQILR